MHYSINWFEIIPTNCFEFFVAVFFLIQSRFILNMLQITKNCHIKLQYFNIIFALRIQEMLGNDWTIEQIHHKRSENQQ